MQRSAAVSNMKMVLMIAFVAAVMEYSSAVYFPPHMIIPAMPLKVEGNPYEETEKLPPSARCPGFRRCEIREEDEERINNHLKETRCPLLPICYNRTSTTAKPAPAVAVPVALNMINSTSSTTAVPSTDLDDDMAKHPALSLEPLPYIYAAPVCPYLEADLKNNTFVEKNFFILKSIGCRTPSKYNLDEDYNTTTVAQPAAAAAANETANAETTAKVTADAVNGTAATNETNANATNAAADAATADETNASATTANEIDAGAAEAAKAETARADDAAATTVSSAPQVAAYAADAAKAEQPDVVAQKIGEMNMGDTIINTFASVFKRN